MNLVVIGVNHKTAPVALRERLAFVDDDIRTAQPQLHELTDGSVIVSTCNRTELYTLAPTHGQSSISQANNTDVINPTVPELTEGMAQHFTDKLMHWLADFKHLPMADVQPYLYTHIDAQALTHWLRVAAGLDSMILGEPQIFGQIKKSVNQAKTTGLLTNHLNWITEQVFAAAKQVRNETAVGTQAVSLGFAAAKLVTQIFDNPQETTLLVIAAGEMNRLVAQHIADLGIRRVLICNRTPERAQRLASELKHPNLQVEVHPLTELADLLPQADIVSSCSGSIDALISRSMTQNALKKRRYKPILMVDLAVPRDIEPDVGKLDDIFLYSIDDLQHVIAGNLEKRRQAAVEAELLVSHLVLEIERRYQVRKVGHDIQQYRDMAKQKADVILEESLHQLHHSNESPEQVMRELTRRLTQMLTHPPSALMRDIARNSDPQVLETVIASLNHAYRSK